jgi:REP element-mobilizing transposase RayT
MPIGIDTFGYDGRLPHLARAEATYFVTFSTADRCPLSGGARDVVLASCVHDHASLMWLTCAVVMLDHVHLILTPYEHSSLGRILCRIKSGSSHRIHRLDGSRGAIWQRESFDRIIRSSENLRTKAEYIANNPVRKGLAENSDAWPWLWRAWVNDRT